MSTVEVELDRRRDPLRWVDLQALRDVAPVLVGLAPFAVVIGIAMGGSGASIPESVLGSLLMWGGSAQLAAVELMGSGAGLLSILATVTVINARFIMYAAALEPRFRAQGTLFRWVGPHFVVDQNYALATSRSDLDDPRRFRRYWITVSAAIGIVWLSVIGSTVAFGAILPPESPLTFASVTVFVGLLVPKLADRRAIVAAGVASVATLAGASFPAGSGLLFGVLAGTFLPALFDVKER